MKYAKWFVVAFVALVLAACARPPTAEVEAARAAVAKAAGDADVVTYQADLLRSAQTALARMEDELKAKRYPAAKTFALEASATAQKASAEAGAAKARVKAEATELIAGLDKAYAEAKKSYDAAKRVRGLKIDLKLVAEELEQGETTANEAKKSLAAGDFKTARDKAASVKAKYAEIQKRLADAVSATKKKK